MDWRATCREATRRGPTREHVVVVVAEAERADGHDLRQTAKGDRRCWASNLALPSRRLELRPWAVQAAPRQRPPAQKDTQQSVPAQQPIHLGNGTEAEDRRLAQAGHVLQAGRHVAQRVRDLRAKQREVWVHVCVLLVPALKGRVCVGW